MIRKGDTFRISRLFGNGQEREITLLVESKNRLGNLVCKRDQIRQADSIPGDVLEKWAKEGKRVKEGHGPVLFERD